MQPSHFRRRLAGLARAAERGWVKANERGDKVRADFWADAERAIEKAERAVR